MSIEFSCIWYLPQASYERSPYEAYLPLSMMQVNVESSGAERRSTKTYKLDLRLSNTLFCVCFFQMYKNGPILQTKLTYCGCGFHVLATFFSNFSKITKNMETDRWFSPKQNEICTNAGCQMHMDKTHLIFWDPLVNWISYMKKTCFNNSLHCCF